MTDNQPVSTPTPLSVETQPVVQSPFGAPPKKSRKGWIIGGIIAGVLVLFGGGGALAYTVWYQHPDKVVHDAIINAVKAKSIQASGKASIELDDDASVDVTFSGKNSGIAGEVAVNADIKIQDTVIKAAGSGLIDKEGVLYFKLDDVRELYDSLIDLYKAQGASTAQIPEELIDAIIEKVDGQWISVKASDYEDTNEETAKVQQCVVDATKKLSDDDAYAAEVKDLYKKHQILVVDEKLGSKKVGNTGSLGYRVSIDKQAVKEFVKSLEGTTFAKDLKACDDSINFDDLDEDLAGSTSDKGVTVTTEVWVSRFTHEFTEISTVAVQKQDGNTANFLLNPEFNTDITVEAPSDTISVKELIETIQEAYTSYIKNVYSQYDIEYDEEAASASSSALFN